MFKIVNNGKKGVKVSNVPFLIIFQSEFKIQIVFFSKQNFWIALNDVKKYFELIFGNNFCLVLCDLLFQNKNHASLLTLFGI